VIDRVRDLRARSTIGSSLTHHNGVVIVRDAELHLFLQPKIGVWAIRNWPESIIGRYPEER
jgi:hypothetical protein